MSNEGKAIHLLEKKPSNQIQFDFNEQVTACIDNARDELTKRPTTGTGLTKAVKVLDDGMELLTTQQKLIRIADRSELGWNVVDEYEANELASGSEDEKKLERAERTAERNAVKKTEDNREAGAQKLYGKVLTALAWSELAGSVMAREPELPNYTGATEEFSTGDQASTLGGSLFWLRGDGSPKTVLS